MNVVTEYVLPDFKQLVVDEQSKDSSSLPSNETLASPYDYAIWMARLERGYVWPRLKHASAYGTHILFVLRAPPTGRVIINLQELVEAARKEIADKRGYSFQVVDFTEMELSDQILLSSRATVFVSSHGAGLTHSMWMHSGSVMFETKSGSNSRQFFPFLAADFAVHSVQYVVQGKGVRDPNNVDSDIEVLDVEDWLEHLRHAVWLSDKTFGIPDGCTKPVSAPTG
jgi:capsular polysaccharide biosynthesis protein